MSSNTDLRRPKSLADLRRDIDQLKAKVLARARTSEEVLERIRTLGLQSDLGLAADVAFTVELIEFFHEVLRFIPEFEEDIRRQVREKITEGNHFYSSIVSKLLNSDVQTGLYHKVQMTDVLLPEFVHEVALGERRQDAMAALWVLDLDRLKLINDNKKDLGYKVGDAIISYIAFLLYSHIRPGQPSPYYTPPLDGHGFPELISCARVGGDEFAVLERSIRNQDSTFQTAKMIKTLYELRVMTGPVA